MLVKLVKRSNIAAVHSASLVMVEKFAPRLIDSGAVVHYYTVNLLTSS